MGLSVRNRQIFKSSTAVLLSAVLLCACTRQAEPVEAEIGTVASVSVVETLPETTVQTTVSTLPETTKIPTAAAPTAARVSVAKSSTAPEALTESLDALLVPYGDTVAVYYKNTQSGAQYIYNPDTKYHIASIVKAPYCMWLLDKASRGEIDLQEPLVYSTQMAKEGSGSVKNLPDGTVLTVDELIAYTVRESDNTAFSMLRSKFGTAEYKRYTKQFDLVYPEDVKQVSNGNLTARDAGQYLAALYRFFSENPNGAVLKAHMQNTKSKYVYTKYPCAQKFGNYDGCYNVIAVVEADEPYFLAVLTRDFENSKAVVAFVREVNGEIQKNG